jgi:cytidine deaminase
VAAFLGNLLDEVRPTATCAEGGLSAELRVLDPVDHLTALIARARDVAARAYAPYSRFRVGAALQDAHGQVFSGCNVESASYGLTICAERNAIFTAIAAGGQRPFVALAVSCLDAAGPCLPCGACRQVMSEHLAENAVVQVDGVGTFSPAQLLPLAFRLEVADS